MLFALLLLYLQGRSMEQFVPLLNSTYLFLGCLLVVVTAINTYVTTKVKLEVSQIRLEVTRLIVADSSDLRTWVEDSFMRDGEAKSRFSNIESRIDRCKFCNNT